MINYTPNPILFNLGIVRIYWYGFLITLGIVLGFCIFYKFARRAGINKDLIFDLAFWSLIFGLIGGRFYHVLSEINYYISHPLEIFYIWNGGMGIFGVLLAGVLVFYIFSGSHPELTQASEGSRERKKIGILRLRQPADPQNDTFLRLLDFLAPALALAQSIGRWGNYFNSELYGSPSNLPWAIPISPIKRLAGFESFTSFHPTFLYESIFCFILFLLLVILTSHQYGGKEGSHHNNSGFIFFLYLLLYSSWRFLNEFLRIDYQPTWLNLRLAQWVSLILIIFSLLFFFKLKKWYNKNKI